MSITFSIPLSFTDQSSSLSLQFLLLSSFSSVHTPTTLQNTVFFHLTAVSVAFSLSYGRLDFLFSISYPPPLSLFCVTSIILSPQPQASRYHRGRKAISCIFTPSHAGVPSGYFCMQGDAKASPSGRGLALCDYSTKGLTCLRVNHTHTAGDGGPPLIFSLLVY